MAGVSQTNRSNSADADGVSTVFNFTFFVYSSDDIKVYSVLDDVLTPITTGITKAINSSFIGGTVTFNTAPADAVGEILIRREVPYTQETEFADITRYKETAIEAALNAIVLQVQQLAAESALSLRYNETAGITDAIIEEPVDGSALVFDGTTGRIRAGATADDIEDAEENAVIAAAAASSATSSASAAAASAAAANAAVQSALWRDVVFVSASTVLDSTYNGKLVRVDTSGGARTITLPQISGLTTPFNVGIEKQTSDGNAVTVARSGSDTIDGGTSKALSSQGAGACFVADTDPSPDEWSALEFGPVDTTVFALKGANTDITSLGALTNINGGQLGGLRNKLINGDFRRWDYATTYSLATSATYGSANRWAVQGGSAAGIFNRDTSIDNGLGFQYNAKLGRNNGSSSTTQIIMAQVLETVNSIPLAGKAVTLSFYAKKGANYSGASSIFGAQINSGTGTDDSAQNLINGVWTGNNLVASGNATLTSSWQRFQYTGTVPSSAKQVGVEFSYTPVGTAGADDNVYIAGCQLEVGSNATVFEDRGECIEKLLCARYLPYYDFPANEVQAGFGQATGNNAITLGLVFPVETRKAPTGITVSGAAHFSISKASGSTVCNSVTFASNASTKKLGRIDAAVATTPFTADTCLFLVANQAASIRFDGCEL